MRFFRGLLADLSEPGMRTIVALLALLAVAVPVGANVLLSTSPATTVAAVPPVPAKSPRGVPAPSQELAALQNTPAQQTSTYHGTELDPFRTGGSSGSSSSGGSSSSSSTSTSSSSSSSSSSSPSSSSGSGSHALVTSPQTKTKTKVPTTKKSASPKKHTTKPKKRSVVRPTVGPASLSALESYVVTLRTVDATGTHTDSNVERLSVLPARDSAEVVFLGVLKGGKKAAFLFSSHVSVVRGSVSAGECFPSASNCQIIELSPGQQMKLSPTKLKALIYPFTFGLVRIGVEVHSSGAAATHERGLYSQAGQQLVSQAASSTLRSLRFSLPIGALVHQTPPPSTGASGASGATGTSGVSGSTGSTGSSPSARTRGGAPALATTAPSSFTLSRA